MKILSFFLSFSFSSLLHCASMINIYTYLTDTSDSRVNIFATVYILNGGLAEEKEDPVSNVEGANEVWFC